MERVAVPLLAAVALLVTGLAARENLADRDPEGCGLVGVWEEGDIHFWETLALYGNGTGVWESGGYDDKAPQREEEFYWSRSGNKLTVDGRTVDFELERHDNWCWLIFDDGQHPFHPDRGILIIFSRQLESAKRTAANVSSVP